jgi:hypothetical protein
MQANQQRRLITTSLALFALGCGGGGARSHEVPWEDDRTQVLTPDRTISSFTPTTGDGCLPYEGVEEDVCIRPQEVCGEEAADVVLDERGEVLDIICYPAGETVTVEQIEAEAGNIAQNENNAVLVLDGAEDGVDLDGDLAIDANNVVVYGAGPDVSVISGDVTVDGNNTLIRGVRIQGNVNVLQNDAIFLFCVIEGNLTIPANNTRVLGCDVYGDVIITGNNTELASDRLAGDLSNSGMGLSCDSNKSFEDKNGDLQVSEDELGGDFECGGKDDK